MITKGIIYICVATFAFAWMNVIAKYLSDFHALQIVFFRAFGSFAVIFPYMIAKKVSLVGNNPKLLFLRGFLGLLSLSTFFMAIQLMPLGSAISIRYIGPIFGSALAIYFLKEKISKWQWLSFIIAFSGVLIIKGFDPRIPIIGFLFVIISAFFLGGIFVLIRYLGTREHYMTIILYFMLISMAGALFFIPYWRMPIGWEWWPVLSIGVVGAIGQIFMTQAFQLEETSVLAPFKYMELIYALLIGLVLFGEKYSWIVLLGMCMIIIGMVTNVYWKVKK